MIKKALSELNLFEKNYPCLAKVSEFLKGLAIESLPAGKTQIDEDISVVKIIGTQPTALVDILEYHKEFIDVHVTIEGEDLLRFKALKDCKNEKLVYQPADDYGLFSDSFESELMVSPEEFCLIDTDMAHMAMCGEGDIVKLVFKVKKEKA